MSEHDEQAALLEWCAWSVVQRPELAYLYAIPNGGARPAQQDAAGRRYSVSAARLKDEGVRDGVPDLHLPVARGGYVGLWIEMKHGRGRVRASQQRWINWLRLHGHRVEVCWQWQTAKDVLVEYLNQPEGEHD